VATKTFKRRKDADAYATGLDSDRLRGVVIDPRRAGVTLRVFATTYFKGRHDLGVRTADKYQGLLDLHILPALGDIPLNKITPSTVRTWNTDLGTLAWVRADEVNRQGGTISSVLAVGHVVGDDFIDYRYIYAEPPPDVPEDLRRTVPHHYGMIDLAAGTATEVKAGRNDPCPCGSGLKFKFCKAKNASG
jgi:hypothetical protein